MGMHPLARLGCMLAGFSLFPANDYRELAPSAAIVFALYAALGRTGLLVRYALMTAPLLLAAIALWFFVHFDFLPGHAGEALARALNGERSAFPFVRLLTATALVFLALATTPDGDMLAVLRRLGLPHDAAAVLAAGYISVAGAGDAASAAYASLRAQGVAGPSWLARLARLGDFAALTWTAALAEVAARARVKWERNGFYAKLRGQPGATKAAAWDTAAAAAAALSLFLINFWAWALR